MGHHGRAETQEISRLASIILNVRDLFNRDRIEHQLAHVTRNEPGADDTAVWDAGSSTIDAVVSRPHHSQGFARRYDCTVIASDTASIASKRVRACNSVLAFLCANGASFGAKQGVFTVQTSFSGHVDRGS